MISEVLFELICIFENVLPFLLLPIPRVIESVTV